VFKAVAASVLVMSSACKHDNHDKPRDPYETAWEQFHKAPPTTLEKAQTLLGSKGKCSHDLPGVICEWSVPTATAPKRIQVVCDDDSAGSRVQYAVFPDETDRGQWVPVTKCTCEPSDPLCAEIPTMTCVRQ
jgi:hypothetical protein